VIRASPYSLLPVIRTAMVAALFVYLKTATSASLKENKVISSRKHT